MGRLAVSGALGVVLAMAGAAWAQAPAPPLTGPADLPAPAELPPVIEAQPLPRQGRGAAVYAVPGIPLSGERNSSPLRTPPMPAASAPGELPALVGPAESFSTAPPAAGARRWPAAPAPNFPDTFSLDPATPGVLNSTPTGVPRAPSPRPGTPADEPRRPGLFNRWQSPFGRLRERQRPDDVISVEPRSDPASDAALKRRLEQQIGTSLGRYLRSVDVKVVDRDVAIQARVSRFWYRRYVRRSLESLPGLAGYRTHIEVVD